LNKKFFASLLICLSTGIASAILSLVVLSFLDPFLGKLLPGQTAYIAGLVVFEELSKLVAVWLIFYLIIKNLTFLNSFIYSIFLALGFFLFEGLLILLNQDIVDFLRKAKSNSFAGHLAHFSIIHIQLFLT